MAGAILAGNLCLNWTEELYATSGLAAEDLTRARGLFDRMRTQLMAGQFLDVVESVRPWAGLDDSERVARASRVIRYKSAKYTIEHPLLIGATTGGLGETDLTELSSHGLDLGHAFQLRDDVLGVSGTRDDRQTGRGRPEGGQAHRARGAHPHRCLRGRPWAVEELLGRADLAQEHVEDLRAIITESGAVTAVEAEISRLAEQSRALGRPRCRRRRPAVLADLVEISTARTA